MPAKSEIMSGWLEPGSMRAPARVDEPHDGPAPAEAHLAEARDLLLAGLADATRP